MKKCMYLSFLLVLIASAATAQSNAGEVWFSEPGITAQAGTTFVTNILVNTGSQKLAAYTFELSFDANVIAVDTSVGTSGVKAGPDGFVTVVNTATAGKLTIASFDVLGKGPATNLRLLSIQWKAVGGGTTSITNNVTNLSDESTYTIGTPRGVGLNVTVTGPTILWSSTPSPTPTPTPSIMHTHTDYHPSGDVWFAEPDITAQAGTTFVTNIRVNTGSQKLAAYTFELSFNSSVIAVDTTVGTNGVTAGPDGFVILANPNVAGKLIISSFDVTGKGPSTSLRLLSIQWKTIGGGTTTITNNVTALSDETTATIGTPKGSGLNVTVTGPTVSPTLTPVTTAPLTPTPTPTLTPTLTPRPTQTGLKPGDVWFAEGASIATSGKFVTNILVNTGTQKLAAYTFEIAFDPKVIAVDTSVGTSGVTPGADGFVTVVNATTPGKLLISSFDVTGKGPSAGLRLLSIAWNAVADGSTVITNNITAFSDETAAPISTPYGYSLQVYVIYPSIPPTITPPPTLTPTPTPTPSQTNCGCTTQSPTPTPTTCSGCNNPVPISGRFVKDGAGEFTWSTASVSQYINSWNVNLLEVNGVDFTNRYVAAANLPARQNGLYIIHYKGSYAWSHVEIVEAGGVVSPTPTITPIPTATPTPIGTNNVGNVWFAEPGITAQAGTTFVTNILVNTGSQKLAAYSFDLSFNANVIAVDTTVGTNGVTAGPDGFVTVVNPNVAGKLTISSFDVIGKGPSTSLRLISIQWKAIGGSTTTITNNVMALSDETTATIGAPYGYSLQVTVGGATISSSPTPTPTPTATPTQTSFGCSNPTAITVPFTKDGAGEFCWTTTSVIQNINSWNLDLLEINGVNLTNKWVVGSGLPAKQNGLYYIHYKASYGWSHFEAK